MKLIRTLYVTERKKWLSLLRTSKNKSNENFQENRVVGSKKFWKAVKSFCLIICNIKSLNRLKKVNDQNLTVTLLEF